MFAAVNRGGGGGGWKTKIIFLGSWPSIGGTQYLSWSEINHLYVLNVLMSYYLVLYFLQIL